MTSTAITSSTLLYQGWGSLTQHVFHYRRVDGATEEMSREVYDRGHAASVLLHNPSSDTVILVRQFRPAPMVNGDDPYMLEACAGILEGDEPEQCVRREALEEAGVVVKDLKFVAAAYGNPAGLTEVVSMFVGSYGEDDRSAGGGLAHEGEDIEVVEVPFQTAFDMIASGDIVDMKTIILLQHMMIERMRATLHAKRD